MILETVFTLLAIYKPLHVMDTPELSCGASERFMKEKVRLELTSTPKNVVIVNRMEWDLVGQDEDGDWVAQYQVRPDQYMKMELTFNIGGAYLSIEGIDSKRRPCKDMVYLKRIK